MRRSDREITDRTEIIQILQDCDVIHLAICSPDGPPCIVPMSFGMEDTDQGLLLWFHSAKEGRKIRLLEQNPTLSFEADTDRHLLFDGAKQNCSTTYRSVIGTGTIRFVSEEEKLHGLQCLMAHYHMEEKPINTAMIPHTAVFCLKAETLTGKQRKKPE